MKKIQKKRSIIHTISKEDLQALVNESVGLGEVLNKLGFRSTTGGSFENKGIFKNVSE